MDKTEIRKQLADASRDPGTLLDALTELLVTNNGFNSIELFQILTLALEDSSGRTAQKESTELRSQITAKVNQYPTATDKETLLAEIRESLIQLDSEHFVEQLLAFARDTLKLPQTDALVQILNDLDYGFMAANMNESV